MTNEQQIAAVKKLRPIDDVLFEMLARNRKVIQEILRVILKQPELVVKNVITQSSKRNPFNRSVILDVLCTLNDLSLVNLEVQRADDDDHIRRVRYNAASITVHNANPGIKFRNIPNLKVVYITEFDYHKKGVPIYWVNKHLEKFGDIIDDGTQDIYVNAAVDDGSELAALMKCFLQTEVNDNRFPELSKEMKRLKNTEKGVGKMCKVIEELIAQEMKEKDAQIAKMKEAQDAQLSKKNAQLSKKNAQIKAKNQYIAELERRLGLI